MFSFPAICPTARSVISSRERWTGSRRRLGFRRGLRRPSGETTSTTRSSATSEGGYRLRVIRGNDEPVRLTRGCLRVAVPEVEDRASIRDRLVDWYASHALDRLQQRTRALAKELGVQPPPVAVQAYRGRWGSCTSDGRITYNWKIIVAPPEIVDYVVVHELCHLLELNHSPAYWDLVRRVMPDYRDARKWLRENGHLLDV